MRVELADVPVAHEPAQKGHFVSAELLIRKEDVHNQIQEQRSCVHGPLV